jgi:hypothetical protein
MYIHHGGDHWKGHDIPTCEIWARVEGTSIISSSGTQIVWLDFVGFVGIPRVKVLMQFFV